MTNYYKDILASIITGRQPDIKELIDCYLMDGYGMKFDNLTIAQAERFLEDHWKMIEPTLV